jgi:hypothetical protein
LHRPSFREAETANVAKVVTGYGVIKRFGVVVSEELQTRTPGIKFSAKFVKKKN